MNYPLPYMDSIQARDYLEHHDCVVDLYISLKEHKTQAGISDNDQVWIKEFGYTHIHNIKAIKIDNELVEINWFEPQYL